MTLNPSLSKFFGLPTLLSMQRDYLGFLQSAKLAYGDAVSYKLLNETRLDLFHPELIREALIEKNDAFIRWERSSKVFSSVHGQNILTTENEVWKRQRSVLQPGFSSKRMLDYFKLMQNSAITWFDKFQKLENSSLININAEKAMSDITMQIILHTLFSQEDETIQSDGLSQSVKLLSKTGFNDLFLPFSFPDYFPHRRSFAKAKYHLISFIAKQIKKRKNLLATGATIPNDLLGMMLASCDSEDKNMQLSDKEVHDQCMAIFMAGHETSEVALAWWLGIMGENQQAFQKAQQEVDSVLNGRNPTYEDLNLLPFLTQTIKESLRIYPTAPNLFTRRAVKDFEIGGKWYKANTLVSISPWVLHHDSRWFPKPDLFLPERFSTESAKSIPRGAYLPFGLGPHVCIGGNFAMMEITLISSMLLQRFNIRGQQALPKPNLEVVLRPVKPLFISLERRK